MNRRRAGLLILQSLFGLTLLWIWVRAVDLSTVGTILSQARWPLVLLAATLGFSSSALRVLRWKILLRPIARVAYLDLYAIAASAALVNFLIPLRTGEATKGLLLKRRHRAAFAASLPTIAIDRGFDLLAVLALGTAGAVSGVQLDRRLSIIILLGGVLLLAMVGWVWLAVRGKGTMLAILTRVLPSRLGESVRVRIVGAGEAFLSGFSTAWQRPRDLALVLLLTLAAIAADVVYLYLLFFSLGPPAPVAVIATGFALLTLTWIVPAAPAYIGSTEAFGSLIFTGLGLGREVAASAILLNHAMITVTVTSVGVLGMAFLGLGPLARIRSAVLRSPAPAVQQVGESQVPGGY